MKLGMSSAEVGESYLMPCLTERDLSSFRARNSDHQMTPLRCMIVTHPWHLPCGTLHPCTAHGYRVGRKPKSALAMYRDVAR